jgi:hypothetical protein
VRELRAAQALDRLRRCAAAEARAGALEARLAAAGAPRRWPLSNARWAAVDTPATSRRGSKPRRAHLGSQSCHAWPPCGRLPAG